MKKNLTKKIFLIGFFSIVLFSAFLTPMTKAQVWTYNGADTVRIPSHSVYPSELYVYNVSSYVQRFYALKVSHGNVSDLGSGNTFCMWLKSYIQNATSGELEFTDFYLGSSWNESIGFQGGVHIIPVEDDGNVSKRILDAVKDYYIEVFLTAGAFEFNQSYLGSNSIAFWNSTSDNSYVHFNYTDDGIMTANTWYYPPIPIIANSTLISAPAQLPPEFSFTTEDGILNISSSSIKLKVNITEADNNNNGVIDADYLYRVYNGMVWTNWTDITALIDYDLSSIPSGSHQITVEVKNMYGITQEQITIEYTAPTHGDIGIPGYSTILLTAILLIGVSIILFIKVNSKE